MDHHAGGALAESIKQLRWARQRRTGDLERFNPVFCVVLTGQIEGNRYIPTLSGAGEDMSCHRAPPWVPSA